MTMEKIEDSQVLGVQHKHVWQAITARPGLQSAHDQMRWDVSKSRLLEVSTCTVCGAMDRESVRECAAPDCHDHSICERPHR
jgi:hypothetical protein